MNSAPTAPSPTLRVLDLRCDQLREPIGLENLAPRLSWRIDADGRRGARQTAYRIQASTTRAGAADLWDSGRVESDETLGIIYGGSALSSRQRVWWTVEAWDETGAQAVSEPAFWEMGLLRAEDWAASWIGMELTGGPERGTPAPFLRKGFTLRERPTAARLYVSALGLYEFSLNGKRVGRDELAPGWTDYTKRVPYQVHDVTAALSAGENRMGAILGDGWFCGHVAWNGREIYGDRPWLVAQLEVSYADGTAERFASDGSWEGRFGPIISNDIFQGEVYDARRELPGWCETGGSNEGWRAVTVRTEAVAPLCFRLGPPVVTHEEIAPIAEPNYIRKWDRTATIYDFGQNLVGRLRVHVKGKAGTVVKLRHAEMLQPNGDLYVENLRTAAATDMYTLKGAPEGETWEPRFTFHGFRYAELAGLAEVDATSCTAVVMHSDTPRIGDFACSDPLLNQLWRNIDWGQRGNFVEVPTDCPQRDERLGWTGDAQVFVRTAAWNRDVVAFFNKWARDVADSQGTDGRIPSVVPNGSPTHGFAPDDGGPGWASAAVVCPWVMYERFGDVALLEREYETMVRFIDYMENSPKTRDLIHMHPDAVEWAGFGDWLALDGSGRTDGGTPKDLLGTAFFAHDAAVMVKVATLLGKRQDAARFAELRERVKTAFQRRFVTPEGLVAGQTQTSYVLALQFDLVPEESRAKAAAELVRDIRSRGYMLTTGFLGTSYLPFVLSDTGHVNVAYRLLLQTKWPSWLYAVTQGATTIWERWDGWTQEKGFQSKGMNSFNHYAYGAIGDWMTRVMAGVATDDDGAGYKRIVLRPQIGGPTAEQLTHARASLETRHGRVASEWRRQDGGGLTWKVEVPANTTATAWVPASEGALVTEADQPLDNVEGLRVLRRETDSVVVEIPAGHYRFEVKQLAPVI
jgi:alpha-L-rhamnosidase